MLIPIVRSNRKVPTPGDFGARISPDAVEVPAGLFAVLSQLNLRTAEAFLNFVQAFPSALARPLRWRPEDVRTAVHKLEQDLSHVAPGENWSADRHPRRAFGARKPVGA